MTRPDRRPDPEVRFNSPEELAELSQFIRGRLHYANRVGMGESTLAWHIANLYGRLGDLMHEADDELFAEFGNGYQPGTLDGPAQRERLIELLFPK